MSKESNFAADVYGLMSIATKYQVDTICAAVTQHLKQLWPTSLKELVQARRVGRQLYDRLIESVTCSVAPDPEDLVMEPASVIRLATDFIIPEVLPAAYYQLSLYDITRPQVPGPRRTSTPRWELLRPEELLRYYQGRAKLARAFAGIPILLTININHECETVDWEDADPGETECQKVKSLARANHGMAPLSLQIGFEIVASADPIYRLAAIYGSDDLDNLCDSCRFNIRSHCTDRLESLWMALPEIFSLEVRFADSDVADHVKVLTELRRIILFLYLFAKMTRMRMMSERCMRCIRPVFGLLRYTCDSPHLHRPGRVVDMS